MVDRGKLIGIITLMKNLKLLSKLKTHLHNDDVEVALFKKKISWISYIKYS